MASLHAILALVADRRCAVGFPFVVEVIPAVECQPAVQVPAWMRGWINYRGRLIPCLDLSDLMGTGRCPPRMGNRILVVSENAGVDRGRLAGVLVEALAGHEPVPVADAASGQGAGGGADRLLGATVLSADGPVQWIEPAELVQRLAAAGVYRS